MVSIVRMLVYLETRFLSYHTLMVKKVFLAAVVVLTLLGGFLMPAPALAGCTDAQVDGWLTQQKLARNGENLNQAFKALGDCAGLGKTTTLHQGIGLLNAFVNTLFPFIMGLALLVILFGILRYLAGAGEEEKRAEANVFIVWGIVGLFIMVSLWGFVNLLVGTFKLDTAAPTIRPTLPPIPGA